MLNEDWPLNFFYKIRMSQEKLQASILCLIQKYDINITTRKYLLGVKCSEAKVIFASTSKKLVAKCL